MKKKIWQPLIDWFENILCAQNVIKKDNLELFKVVDDPQLDVDEIMKFYQDREIQPTQVEQEKRLHL